MELQHALSQAQIQSVRELFEEYAASLRFDLDFQDFAAELESLPGDYAPPAGCLLLAIHDGQTVGCVGLRPLEAEICEMKRLYVRPQFRGLGAGHALAEAIVGQARAIGYARMRLDTIIEMDKAQSLYEKLGFVDIAPYRHNPLEGVRYMELDLLQKSF